jgi:hypothetical protein
MINVHLLIYIYIYETITFVIVLTYFIFKAKHSTKHNFLNIKNNWILSYNIFGSLYISNFDSFMYVVCTH